MAGLPSTVERVSGTLVGDPQPTEDGATLVLDQGGGPCDVVWLDARLAELCSWLRDGDLVLVVGEVLRGEWRASHVHLLAPSVSGR